MTVKMTFISSDNMNNDPQLKDKSRAYLDQIQEALGEPIVFATPEEQQGQGCVFIYVASGGSEMAFIDVMKELRGYVCLISTDNNSSLAASMEMMAWLRENGRSGEIVHGTLEQVVSQLKDIVATSEACQRFVNGRLGVIGRAEERIASFIDQESFEEMTGAPIEWISMNELLAEIETGGYPDNQWTKELLRSNYDHKELEKALTIYGALARIVTRHKLGAVSVRCFDLLKPTKSTGCLALAILNALGIPATCEGDVKSLVTMMAAYAVTGKPSFMANPSRLDPCKREIVFAHCTVPMNLPSSYHLTTHYESGTGIGVAGEMPLGPCTVVKTNGIFTENYVESGTAITNLNESNLCRTQIVIQMDGEMEYFLKRPIANHHMICFGDYKNAFEHFFAMMRARSEKTEKVKEYKDEPC